MRALLCLLSVLILLESSAGFEYDKLEDCDKNTVNKAIKQANEQHAKGKHLDVAEISHSNGNIPYVLLLKPTSCADTVEKVHLKNCKIQGQTPQVYCVTCKEPMSCFLRKDIEKVKEAFNKCWVFHGSGHVLSQKGKNGEYGCLGCI